MTCKIDRLGIDQVGNDLGGNRSGGRWNLAVPWIYISGILIKWKDFNIIKKELLVE